MKLHPLPSEVLGVEPPPRFTYPFCYQPHPLCIAAADEVRHYLSTQPQWSQELQHGKMLGVLVVQHECGRGFLAAFSGTLGGQTLQNYFVPPVFDLMRPGCHFQTEQEAISDINHRIEELEKQIIPSSVSPETEESITEAHNRMKEAKARRDTLRRSLSAEELAEREPEFVRESQFLKAEFRRARQRLQTAVSQAETRNEAIRNEIHVLQTERTERSQALQEWLFRRVELLNALGQRKNLLDIFSPQMPPSGAGDCCAPKLLQYAYDNSMQPLCMAEFWVGDSPCGEIRRDGHYYSACRSRCLPILSHMLQGLRVDENPLLNNYQEMASRLHIVWQDSEMVVVSKPSGMLSVPGRDGLPSVLSVIRSRFPDAPGPMIVHRLDMDTSGLMVVSLTQESYHRLQTLFSEHKVEKTYAALLQHPMPIGQQGTVRLPLRPDYADRPRQMVDFVHGRQAVTNYEVVDNTEGHALVKLRPLTGRTHQLRVHCAHPQGLDNPIMGDRLYGMPDSRLMLHACRLRFLNMDFKDPAFNIEKY